MDRINNQVLDILSGILIKYINLSDLGFVTFSKVTVAPDLRSAKVFYSIIDKKKADDEINIEINKKRKAFKKYMAPQLHFKHTPDLRFYLDESLFYERRINNLLKDIDKQI
tara:strand:+ start:3419 stop:3751 length:333 start_codon:yes stop_codon:yes gene_type:complete